jgi:hypothetical protein
LACRDSWHGRDQMCLSRPTDHQEHNRHRDDGKAQGNAQHPADSAGCLALPGLGRGLYLTCGGRYVGRWQIIWLGHSHLLTRGVAVVTAAMRDGGDAVRHSQPGNGGTTPLSSGAADPPHKLTPKTRGYEHDRTVTGDQRGTWNSWLRAGLAGVAIGIRVRRPGTPAGQYPFPPLYRAVWLSTP